MVGKPEVIHQAPPHRKSDRAFIGH